jgi:condensation domain-containing protein
MKKNSVRSLTPEQKRAMLARMLEQKSAVVKTAFIIQGLILDCMMYNTPIWNMRSTIRLFHKVDPELLRTRMQRIIDRHPALRTTYAIPAEQDIDFHAKMLTIRIDAMKLWELNLETQVEQHVHPSHTLDFRVVDASEWSAEKLRERLLADALEMYDLTRLPVCRLRLYQRQSDDVMQLDLHHCAADLWSMEIIMAELEDPPEGPAPPGFPEFCLWQHAWFELPKAKEMRDWWSRELEGCPDLAFPYSLGDDPADFVLFRLDGDLIARARQVCRTHKVTMFNLVLSTLQVTLARSLGMEDFALGGAVANRPHQRFEQTVGFFAQLALYRRDLSEVASWDQLWARNRTTIGEVLKRQFFPVTTTMQTPRTDVWIMFQQYQKARWVEGDVPEGEPLGLRSGGVVRSPLGPWEFLFVEPPFLSSPVMLEMIEQKEGMQGIFRYRKPCFSRAQAESYAADFQALLRESLANPDHHPTLRS